MELEINNNEKEEKGIEGIKEVNEFLKDTLFKQIDSIAETLQIIALNKDCNKSISKILFNQIGNVLLLKDENNLL
ncbi:hypothetical protein [Faecalibacillus intestinalis]|uniref:hypothetical protein n=1 Tax=Faecalibacillus intestinalis TaxID=1982626 RepID=UPI003AB3F9E0